MPIQDYQDLQEGDIVVIAAFDGWPEHLFEVDQTFDDSGAVIQSQALWQGSMESQGSS